MRIRLAVQPAKKETPDRRRVGEVLGKDSSGSPRGSTYYKRMTLCPREHALHEIANLRVEKGDDALDTGDIYHRAQEAFARVVIAHQRDLEAGRRPLDDHYYFGAVEAAEAAAWSVIEPFEREDGYEETAEVLARLLQTYFETYRRADRERIIATEQELVYTSNDFDVSVRLDRLVERANGGGLWVKEHKTARAITDDLISGYALDMQILAQIFCMRECVDLTGFQPFRGVIVDIITKHKKPQTQRIEVTASDEMMAAFAESMRARAKLTHAYAALDWPRFYSNCHGSARYFRRCAYYDLCRGRPSASVAQLAAEPPPMGFYRPGEDEAPEREAQED